jgi:hypothetical protein
MPTLLPSRRSKYAEGAPNAHAPGFGMPRWWWIMIAVGLILWSIFVLASLSPEPCWMKGKTIELEEFIEQATC